MILLIAPWIPIALEGLKYVGENVLAGVNNRKARLYNSPAEQVKRLQQAGLPQAAGSSIGGGTTVGTEVKQGPSVQDTIAKGVSTEQARIAKQVTQQQLREATARADLAEGEAKNKLNPSGTFENTNQGISIREDLARQTLGNDASRIVNEWMPKEKGLELYAKGVGINKTLAETRNTLKQFDILVSEAQIKNILAEYQERMSAQELTNIIRRNTGLKLDNQIKKIEWNIAWQTQLAKISMARNQALMSGEQYKVAQYNAILSGIQSEHSKMYYDAISRMRTRWNDGDMLNDIYSIKELLQLTFFNQKGDFSLNPTSLLNFAK